MGRDANLLRIGDAGDVLRAPTTVSRTAALVTGLGMPHFFSSFKLLLVGSRLNCAIHERLGGDFFFATIIHLVCWARIIDILNVKHLFTTRGTQAGRKDFQFCWAIYHDISLRDYLIACYDIAVTIHDIFEISLWIGVNF